MRIRVVISGIAASVICLIPLNLLYYKIEPSRFVQGWPAVEQATTFRNWLPTVVIAFCFVTIFASGWIAARWNWAATWRANLLAGAGTGLLTGCLIYDFIGAFWFSIKGQADVLMNFYTPVTEAEGTKILLEAVFQTGRSLYLNFIVVVLSCVVLGSLGALASAIDIQDFWGTDPRKPEGWLFRLPMYLLSIIGILCIIINVAVLDILGNRLVESAIQLKEQYGTQFDLHFSKESFVQVAYLSGLIFIFLPVSTVVGWIIRAWRKSRKQGLAITLTMLAALGGISLCIWFTAPSLLTFTPFAPIYLVPTLITALFVALYIGFRTEDSSEGFPYRLSDWFGYALAYGILGGTQIFLTIAYSLSLTLVTIVNIPHLTASGIVDQSPVNQVSVLSVVLFTASVLAILISFLIGLVVAGVTSLARNLFYIKDISLVRES